MGKGTVTAWQHDARSHDGGRLISIFDNGAAPQVQTQSRVVLVRLDFESMRATLEKSFKHRPNRLVAKFMGNGQLLPDGGVIAGWGSEPFVTEFGAERQDPFRSRDAARRSELPRIPLPLERTPGDAAEARRGQRRGQARPVR